MEFCMERAYYHVYAASNFYIDSPQGPPNYAFAHFLRPMVIYVDELPYRVEAGAFIIYAHGDHQHYYPQTTDMLENWCHFNCSGFEEWMSELMLPMHRPFHVQDATAVDAIFRTMATNYYNGNTKAAALGIQALFYCLAATYQTEKDIAPEQKKLYDLRNLLRTCPEKDWNIAAMAAEINYSESYLNKLYRETFGISPKKDLFHMRMERAKYLLSTTTYSVEYIANQLNYASSTSFISQFHKSVGDSPLQYRKRSQCWNI